MVPAVLLESYRRGAEPRSFTFERLVEEVTARRADEVAPALRRLERAVDGGLHGAGFVTYEAAPGLDPDLSVCSAADRPLLWFGLFRDRHEVAPGALRPAAGYSVSDWLPEISRSRYGASAEAIRRHLAAGDSYQVNFTFRLRASFSGDARALYQDLCRSQSASFCAFLDLGRYCVVSASPELFFARRGRQVTTRPMKGTRPRGRWPAEDRLLATQLLRSPKDRAENVTIVDLLRNDLSRVSEAGSVGVLRLWQAEPYETVWQLTSTVRSRLRQGLGLVELFRGLFPCGSVTGAPKARTMEIISALEDSPRGVYTGAIGYASPGEEACFSVAIRTAWIDREQGTAEYGVGGGVTFDSSADQEYEECLTKARVLTERRPDFALLETLLFAVGSGYFLLERHLARLAESARYFGYPCDLGRTRRELAAVAAGAAGDLRVRLLLDRQGCLRVEKAAANRTPVALRASLADRPVDSRDPLLYHKTTHRRPYDERLAARPGFDEVILHNERGELTECCAGNLVVETDCGRFTPPVECGLLAGTLRAELLEHRHISEKVLTIDDLHRARRLFMINSVRRWVDLVLEDP